MKQISLTQGKFAIVDDQDYDWLNQWKWYYNNKYAKRKTLGGKTKRKTIYMHRLIMNALSGLLDIDHKDGNFLNNRRANLRFCNDSQNQRNKHAKKINALSNYKGVSWHKRNKKWIANLVFNQKLIHIGYFKKEIEAAKAYDKKAKELFGEFARLNDV